MKTRLVRPFIILLLFAALGVPPSVSAVSYAPSRYQRGGIVYIFHSGSDDVRMTIHANDVLTVYRAKSSCGIEETGKIRVISYVGETYMKGQVVEGEIKPGDIAKKGTVSGLIIEETTCVH